MREFFVRWTQNDFLTTWNIDWCWTFCVISLQLSDLEQRVIEAEGRAEEAEDKVNKDKFDDLKRIFFECKFDRFTWNRWFDGGNDIGL